jgi:hypothetical protein
MQSDGIFGLIAIALAFALVIAKEKLLTGRSQKTYRCMLAMPLIQGPIGKDEKTPLRRRPATNHARSKSGFLEREDFLSDAAISHLWPLPEKTLHDHRDYIQ